MKRQTVPRKKRDDQYDPHSPKWCEPKPLTERFEYEWMPFPELLIKPFCGLELRQPIRGRNYLGCHVYELVKAVKRDSNTGLYKYLYTSISFMTRLERNEFLSKRQMRGNVREMRRKGRVA